MGGAYRPYRPYRPRSGEGLGKYSDIAKQFLNGLEDSDGVAKNATDNTAAAPIQGMLFDDRGDIEPPPFLIPTTLIRNPTDLAAWVVEQLVKPPAMLTVDIETTGINFATDRIVGVAINNGTENVYVAFGHENEFGLTRDQAREHLAPLFQTGVPKLAHHATFDIPFLLMEGFAIQGPYYDTRLIAREYHVREHRLYGLKDLACVHVHPRANYWDEQLDRLLKLRFRSPNKKNLWRLPSVEVCKYASADVFLTRKLFDLMKEKASATKEARDYLTLEREVTAVVIAMVCRGFRVDESKLKESLKQLVANIGVLDKELDSSFGRPETNYNSPLQVLPLVKCQGYSPIHPKTRKESVCYDALVNLNADTSVAIQSLIRRRHLENQVKQVAGLPAYIKNGRIHTHLSISAQVGERFSSTGPSLYTGKKVHAPDEVTLRHFIVPDDGYSLVFFDFSASHFRILAHLCSDEGMIEIFKSGRDFHQSVAAMLFGVEYASVTKELRNRAKPLGFGILYGMGDRTLAHNLRCDVAEAKKLRSKLYEVFPRLPAYLKQIYNAAVRNGYVLSGINGIRIAIPRDKAFVGINYQIQCTEAEIIKRTLVKLHWLLAQTKSRVALPVHDEILCEVHRDEHDLIREIRAIIEDQGLKVPIACDVSISATRWALKSPYYSTTSPTSEGISK